MAKTDNLTDFLTDIADAIREKKGTTGTINPQDFSSEIASIESGGGEDSFYWKIEPNLPKEDIKGLFGIFARLLSVVKIEHVGGIFDTTFSFLSKDGNNGKSVYVRTIKSSNFIMLEEDTDGYMGFPYSVTSFDELLVMLKIPKEDAVAIGIVEITKEEFYNLES